MTCTIDSITQPTSAGDARSGARETAARSRIVHRRARLLALVLAGALSLLAGCAAGPLSGSTQHDLSPQELAGRRIVIGQGLAGEKTLLLAPVTGARFSSPFGPRVDPVLGGSGERVHRGLDFAATQGTPVRAAGEGTVIAKGLRGSYGHYVRIRHDDTYETAYAHLSGYAKGIAPGRRVRQDDVIGYVGSTGRSTGPHLHYEVLVDGVQVDPFALETSLGQPNRDGIFDVVRAIGAGIGRAGVALAATSGAVVRPVMRAASAVLGDN